MNAVLIDVYFNVVLLPIILQLQQSIRLIDAVGHQAFDDFSSPEVGESDVVERLTEAGSGS